MGFGSTINPFLLSITESQRSLQLLPFKCLQMETHSLPSAGQETSSVLLQMARKPCRVGSSGESHDIDQARPFPIGGAHLHQLLGFKEALEVLYLPDANGHKDEGP